MGTILHQKCSITRKNNATHCGHDSNCVDNASSFSKLQHVLSYSAVGNYLKVVRAECGRYLKVRRAKRAVNFGYYNALRLLLVASQCTGSWREIFVL